MRDLKKRLADVDHVEFPRELWSAALNRAAGETDQAPLTPPSLRPTSHRIAAIAVAFAVFAAAALVLWNALGPRSLRPRPGDTTPVVNPLSQLPAGWNELPDPPDVRTGAASEWTGSRLLVWGGYVYTGFSDEEPLEDGYLLDPLSGAAEALPPAPLAARAFPAVAWTGSELLVWGGWDLHVGFFDDGAAYDPATGEWRVLPQAPIEARMPFSVWTGSELVVWGSGWRDLRVVNGAAYDPIADSWRSIADAPLELTDGTAVWTGEEMVVFGAALHGGNKAESETAIGAAYDPDTDTWRLIPNSQLSPQASTVAWGGEEMIAWDYLNQSQTYDPVGDVWGPIEDVPLQDFECSPQSVAVAASIVGEYCGQTALYDQGVWSDITRRAYLGWGFELVAADPVVLLLGSNVDTGAEALLAYRVNVAVANSPGAPFEPIEGWNIVLTTIDPNNTQDLPIVWVANVPFSPEESTSGFPNNTVRGLPPNGIVMTVIGPRDYTGDTVFSPATFPLTISQGFCSHDQYETQPAPHVSKCLVDTMVGDQLLNVTVWFGMNTPSEEMYDEANAQLARLVVPGQP
jgi:hypothetical protein